MVDGIEGFGEVYRDYVAGLAGVKDPGDNLFSYKVVSEAESTRDKSVLGRADSFCTLKSG